ncbi:cytochrome P450 [Streptomyces sp. NPDC020965]|uniref:cytochrome P450 n=1 Tax=Streptomyces sp. NPDC020965 TaxID=3365105 RepID=UPI00378D71AF
METSVSPSPIVPGAWPLLGHVPRLAPDPLAFFHHLRDHGPVVRIRLGNRPAYVVTRPHLVRRLHLADQRLFDKGGPLIEKSRLFLGNGLATCPAADHARQRPLMQPAFHSTQLSRYTGIMQECVAEVTGSWQPGQVISLNEEMHRITAKVTSRTLISAVEARPAAAQIARALPEILRGLYWRMVIPGSLFPRIPLPVNRRFDRQMRLTRHVLDQVVSHYRATTSDYGDLLSMVITACEEEDDPQQAIYDQVVTILMGGVETTAATLVWLLRLLDSHPHIRQELLAEITGTLGGRPPGHSDLHDLPYTQQVITETVRLYPAGWIVSRSTTADVHWSEGHIPAGSDVFYSPYALHRDPELFPDPEAFVPDRWSPEQVTPAQRQAFFGFGAGRRKCIGDVFGITEATIAVAAVLSSWHLEHAGPVTDRPLIGTLLMAPPTRMRVQRAVHA